MPAAYVCFELNTVCTLSSSGYDVQSASTPDGVLYITGAPRYNHTGRVVIYRLNEKDNVVISQILNGEQVSLFSILASLSSSCVFLQGRHLSSVCLRR